MCNLTSSLGSFFVALGGQVMSQVGHLFTSESVGPGHPDKICDQISDAILDACLQLDPYSRVACETMVTTNLVVVGGEITTKARINVEAIVRQVLRDIGYTNAAYGIDANQCFILNTIKQQSPNISAAVDREGAGDQGIMFGFANTETEEYMPLPIFLSHRLVQEADKLRKSGHFKHARPDMKSQVTIDYTGKTPRIDTLVMSIQHDENYDAQAFNTYVLETIMKQVALRYQLNTDFKYFINPSGSFVIGGPEGDTGLTGRKIIVDSYGGSAPHGGGAYSGKDASKVDRSAAYAARFIAKNIVAAGLAKECTIQLSYAIGVANPISLYIDTAGTGVLSDRELEAKIHADFPLTPKWIIDTLELRKPWYQKTATYGHFGRSDLNVPWERLSLIDQLKTYIKGR